VEVIPAADHTQLLSVRGDGSSNQRGCERRGALALAVASQVQVLERRLQGECSEEEHRAQQDGTRG
jgi:hypothetical protein